MSDIKRRLKSLLEMRKDTEPAALIIGTVSGFVVCPLAKGMKLPAAVAPGEKFKEFITEQEAREALTAAGIKKIVTLTRGIIDK